MKSKKIIIIAIIVLAIIAVAIAGAFFYLKIMSSPENIFKKAIEEVFKDKEQEYTSLATNAEVSCDIEVTDETLKQDEELKQIIETLNKIQARISSRTTYDGNFINEDISINYDGETLINTKLLKQDEQYYAYFEEFFDKYIVLPEETSQETQILKDFNIDLAKQIIKETLEQEIKNKKFTQEKVEDENNGKVKKTTVHLDGTEIVALMKKTVENLLNNKEFIEGFGENKENIKSEIEKVLVNITDLSKNEDLKNYNIQISIYTKGITNKFAKLDILVIDKVDTTCFKAAITKKSNSTYTVEVLIGEDTIDINKAKTLLQMNYMIDTGDITVKIYTEEGINFIFNIKYKYQYDIKLSKIDVSNNISADELNDKDKKTISKNIVKSRLYEVIKEEAEKSTLKLKVNYIVPENFEEENTTEKDEERIFYTNNQDKITTKVKKGITAESYIKEWEETKKDLDIINNTEISPYSVEDKEYLFKGIVHKKNDKIYVNLCFAIDINNSTYIVEVEAEQGKVSMAEVNEFLKIDIAESNNNILIMLEMIEDSTKEENAHLETIDLSTI